MYRTSSTLYRFFGSPPYFYFRFRLYGHRDGRFCLIFARTAQQSVIAGTNGLSSIKPCTYCRIVRSRASRGNLCDSAAFLFRAKVTLEQCILVKSVYSITRNKKLRDGSEIRRSASGAAELGRAEPPHF